MPAIACLMVMWRGAEYHRARLQAWFGLDNSVASTAGDYAGDYVLVHVAAYYGILAAVLFMVLIAVVFLRLLRVSFRQKNQLGMLMGVSSSVVLLVQVGLYILINTGLMPYIVVYCPFVVDGATGMLVTYSLLGLILSIYRYQNVITQKSTVEGKGKIVLKLHVERRES